MIITFVSPAKFKPNEDLKLKMEENFGRVKDVPLYAYGNKLSFFRLPNYPEENEKRPQGLFIIMILSI